MAHKKPEILCVKRRKERIKKWFRKYKLGLNCSSCGENHPAIIDFHHKNKDKEENVSNMVAYGIIKRIEKTQEFC